MGHTWGVVGMGCPLQCCTADNTPPAGHRGTAILSADPGEFTGYCKQISNKHSLQPRDYGIPTLFNVLETPGMGIKDIKLHTQHLLKEVDEKIFH